MKGKVYLCFAWLVVWALMLCGPSFAQSRNPKTLMPLSGKEQRKFAVLPMKEAKPDAAATAAAAANTLPLWTLQATSPVDGKTYASAIVGRNPFNHGHRATTIRTYVVPVRMAFAATKVLMDPTVANPCLENLTMPDAVRRSPIFINSVLPKLNGTDVGQTQYIDGYQRANLWPEVGRTNYHTLLEYAPLPAVTVEVPATAGVTRWANNSTCGQVGDMDIDWWDGYVQSTLLPAARQAGAGPNSIIVYLLPSVVMRDNIEGCCILGYHSAASTSGGTQTYISADFDASGSYDLDIGALSHELGEWLIDPFTTNLAPSWGHIGQVKNSCYSYLEVGDPLSGSLIPVTSSGFIFNPQELAFVSWFFRQAPGPLATYSNNGKLRVDAGPICH